jgi:mannitol/fructose-specific phosphotransferase system IIA component (Ntr-type)
MLEQVVIPALVRRIDTPTEATVLIRMLSEVMAEPTGLAAPTLEQAFSERLRRGGVATPEGVGFPHAVIAGVRRTCVGLISLPSGVKLDSNQPASDLVFAIAGDAARPWEHVRLLARLSRISVDESARRRLRSAPDGAALLTTLLQEDASHE